MATILGARFDFWRLLGLIVIAAAILFGVWKAIDHFLPGKEPIHSGITIEDIRGINKERDRYYDSLYKEDNERMIGVIIGLINQKRVNDSLLNDLYINKKREYDEKINNVDNYTDSQLLRQWAVRYGR